MGPVGSLRGMPRYLDLSVTLEEAEPPVWRRFLLVADATFADLHAAIQAACGWLDYHLFEFTSPDGQTLAGSPDDEGWRDEPVPEAGATPVAAYFDAHDRCRYAYDFGDDWHHTVVREAVVELDERFHRRLVDGARAFPPEDCGGIGGYEQCVAVARGQAPEEAWVDVEHLRTWMGDWDPERFDAHATRAVFDRVDAPVVRPSPYSPHRFGLPPASALPAVDTTPAEELAAAAAGKPVLDRLAAFVAWVGAGRKLTTTGNLTLADGRELIDVLGTDDRMDGRIGDRVFKTKSTVELRGVDRAYRVARSAGFVKVRKGVLSVTRRGQALGDDPLADWHDALAGVLTLGVLGHRYAHATMIDPYWKDLVDEQVPGLLAYLLLIGQPMAIDELAGRLWSLVEASFDLDDLDDQQYARHRDHLAGDVRGICVVLAELGAVTVEGLQTVTTTHGIARDQGGRVQLTPLGAAGVRRLAAG